MLIQQKVVCYPLSHFSNFANISILTLWVTLLRKNIVRMKKLRDGHWIPPWCIWLSKMWPIMPPPHHHLQDRQRLCPDTKFHSDSLRCALQDRDFPQSQTHFLDDETFEYTCHRYKYQPANYTLVLIQPYNSRTPCPQLPSRDSVKVPGTDDN